MWHSIKVEKEQGNKEYIIVQGSVDLRKNLIDFLGRENVTGRNRVREKLGTDVMILLKKKVGLQELRLETRERRQVMGLQSIIKVLVKKGRRESDRRE